MNHPGLGNALKGRRAKEAGPGTAVGPIKAPRWVEGEPPQAPPGRPLPCSFSTAFASLEPRAMDRRASGNSRRFLLAAWLWMLLECGCALNDILPPWIDHRDICLQQPPDNCGPSPTRWYYDRYTQFCEEFTTGDCKGYENNFATSQACTEKCGKIKRVPAICRLKAEVGICRSLIPRYFFNLTSMECEKFYYGGCEGNENRFDDLTTCLDYCLPVKPVPSFCYRPKDKGLCSASEPRFYYNAKTQTCAQFSYTGCGGNNNNFTSEKSCLKACKKGRRKPVLKKRKKLQKPRT